MRLKTVTTRRGQIYTPLRYPGGKSRLAGFLARLIDAGGWREMEYAEPFAGGAGAALALLQERVVPRIAINDLDPAIYSFWWAVLNETGRFEARVRNVPLTITEWQRQRDAYRDVDADPFDRGFATFYLNRTNRSGVLHAGVIGGQQQAGKYRIDARFNRKELAERVRAIGDRYEDIQLSREDGAAFISRKLSEGSVVYADPPYYDKGSLLYLNAFDDQGHAALANALNVNPNAIWLLTYDDCEPIRRLYRGRYQGTFELQYSAHRNTTARELMVMSAPVRQAMDRLERRST